MPDEFTTADPFARATAAAVADLQAALRATPPAASGMAVGHGTIRLREPSPRARARHAMTAAEPDAARVREPVGHGTIRLREPVAPTARDARS